LEERSQGPDRALSPDPGAAQDGRDERDPGPAEEARAASGRRDQGGEGALSLQADRRGRSGGKAGAAVARFASQGGPSPMSAMQPPLEFLPRRLTRGCRLRGALVALSLIGFGWRQAGAAEDPTQAAAGFKKFFMHDECTGQYPPQPDTCA